ncbi:GFA family protein [Sphingomonas sp. ASV193]|uniref:GFA family protein n=1 Tax=Sphingomonas sp. ASV193 TaxID=3144405 RepID=UPI0032E8BF8A
MTATDPPHSAACRCGQLRADASGTPVRISTCHCLDCQRRTGSPMNAQVRFDAADVTTHGASNIWHFTGPSGNGTDFHFCPTCGSTVYFVSDHSPGTVAIPLGCFDDPFAFAPTVSVYENRKHPWIEIVGDIEHD